jgi:hypothetical protein
MLKYFLYPEMKAKLNIFCGYNVGMGEGKPYYNDNKFSLQDKITKYKIK